MAENALDILAGGSRKPDNALDILNSTVPVKAHIRRPRGKVNMFDQMQATQSAMPGYQQEGLRVAKPVVDMLPVAGSFAGPVGAGVGAALRQGLSTEPTQPMSGAILGIEPGSLWSNVADIAEQATLAKAGEYIGPGLKASGKVATWIGKKTGTTEVLKKVAIPGLKTMGAVVMRAGLGLTESEAATAMKMGFTKSTAKLEALMNRVGQYGDRQLAVLRRAPQVRFNPRQIADYIEQELIAPMEKSLKFGDKVAKLRQFNADMLKDITEGVNSRGQLLHPTGDISAEELHIAAQKAREEAHPLLSKAAEGMQVTIRDPLREQWFSKIVDFANDQLGGPKNLAGVRTGNGSSIGKAAGAAYARLNAAKSKLLELHTKVAPIVRKAEEGGVVADVLQSINPYTAAVVALGGAGGFMANPHSSWQGRAAQGLMGSVAAGYGASKAPNIALLMADPRFARAMAMLQQTIGAAMTAPPDPVAR
jgi:hypothetical protein